MHGYTILPVCTMRVRDPVYLSTDRTMHKQIVKQYCVPTDKHYRVYQ